MRRRPGGDELGGGGEKGEPQAAGLPEPGLATQCRHRYPGEQVKGDLGDLQPDLVLRGVVQWRITQASGAGGTDAVLGPGPLPVTQFEGSDRLTRRVGGEAGQLHAVGVDEAQLGAGVWPFLAHDQPQPLRPAGQAVAGAFGAQAPSRMSPSGSTAGVQAEAETFKTAWWVASVTVMPTEYDSHRPRRVNQATNSWVPPPESVGGPASPPEVFRQLGQGQSMWSAAVLEPALPGRSRPTTGSPELPPAVVDGPHQRVVAEGLLPGRGGVPLLGVRQHENAVDAHDHLPARVRRRITGQLPDVFAHFGAVGAQRGQDPLAARCQLADQAGDRRVGGHRPEHGRLGPQQRHIGQAIAAQRDRERHIQQDLAGIVNSPGLPPRLKRRRYRRIQTGLADRLEQQHHPGLRSHSATAALDADTRVGPDTLLHPENASDGGGNKDLSNPHSR